MSKKTYDDDDGRTVADMSGIERQPLFIPRFPKKNKRADFSETPSEDAKPEWEVDTLNKKERGAFISGVLSAAVAIAAVFAAAIAVAILVISHMGH